MGMQKYVCFTLSIIPIEEHLFVKPASYEQKIKWLKDAFFNNLDLESKDGTEYAIRIIEPKQLEIEHKDSCIIGKLSKKKHAHLHEKTPEDIEDKYREDWPYVGFIFDMRENIQKFILEHDKSFIRSLNSFRKTIEELINERMFEHGYSTSLELKIKEKAFWNIVDSADGVYSLTFELLSPNIFGASSKASESLKELQKILNNNKTKVTFINDKGKLKIPKDTITTYQEYADAGAGSWKIIIHKNNKKRGHYSAEKALTISVEAEDKADVSTLMEALQKFLDTL